MESVVISKQAGRTVLTSRSKTTRMSVRQARPGLGFGFGLWDEIWPAGPIPLPIHYNDRYMMQGSPGRAGPGPAPPTVEGVPCCLLALQACTQRGSEAKPRAREAVG